MGRPVLRVRRRDGGGTHTATIDWRPERAAVVVCDMWNAHHCRSAAARVAEMAPEVDRLLSVLRSSGTLVIHAPSGCIDHYEGTRARMRALEAPGLSRGIEFDWRGWDSEHEAALPPSLSTPGGCSCDSPEPCCGERPPHPWSRQIESIGIEPEDAVSDDGAEIHDLLGARGIDVVLVLGVHTNLCVLGRPFGIRQLVYAGKRPLLVRDLTDSFHRDPMGHCAGTDRVVEHIERYWCPSVTSEAFTGGRPFRFRECGGRDEG